MFRKSLNLIFISLKPYLNPIGYVCNTYHKLSESLWYASQLYLCIPQGFITFFYKDFPALNVHTPVYHGHHAPFEIISLRNHLSYDTRTKIGPYLHNLHFLLEFKIITSYNLFNSAEITRWLSPAYWFLSSNAWPCEPIVFWFLGGNIFNLKSL